MIPAPRSPVWSVLDSEKLLPVVVLDDAAAAGSLGTAIRAGGLSSIEITLRTPAALPAITALAEQGDLLVGAGTVLTRTQAELAVEAGADFIVSPGVSSAVVSFCREVGVPVFPGVATPTEIQMALDLGCDVVKFFPADINGGLPAIRALAAPFGGVKFIPTGGISPSNLGDYLAHPSVLAVGGSWLVTRELIAANDWSAITGLVEAAVDIAGRRTTSRIGGAHG
ncbi:MAG TPA: bifunctional 4-hydroxy-2-oxoglutarate aldolase/2-dehydro-3-deoxy-phosphogluconate aldolase [Acidothermaceae bacterium]